MHPLLEQHRGEIESLCRKYGIKRLELFGSAARSDFNDRDSDFDFFYEFDSSDWRGMADRFFGLLEDLQRLLGRRVDLVSLRAARNPYFLESAARDKITLYAA